MGSVEKMDCGVFSRGCFFELPVILGWQQRPGALSRILRLFISAQHRLYIHAGKKRSAARAQALAPNSQGAGKTFRK